MKQITIILFLLFSTFNMASATTVDQANSAVFSFDVSTLGAESISGFNYSTLGTGPDDRLSSGASMLLSFGSNTGTDDIGSFQFINRFSFAINNVSTGIFSAITLPASLNQLFVTVGFIDDIFGIETLNLNISSGGQLSGTAEGSVSTVPLPAAAWLFGSVLLGFFGFSRRKSDA